MLKLETFKPSQAHWWRGDELLKFLKGEFLSSRWRSIIMGGLCVINHIMREVISGRTHHDDRPATEGYERKRNSVPLSQCSVISSKTRPRERCNFVQSSDRHRRAACKLQSGNGQPNNATVYPSASHKYILISVLSAAARGEKLIFDLWSTENEIFWRTGARWRNFGGFCKLKRFF